ncbi:hypothetical protein C1H46_019163 [Malus baccata]|uniref:NB-ARC domain-containing protein n=1 Tax=Malus baccata TaxID=106549 RepID=A0A540M933_MALBA|nr:hypothetical protein C1H46_019163 [Malus baccata]
MEVMNATASKIGECLVTPIRTEFGYLINYHSNLESLEGEIKKLFDKKGGVQGLVDAAKRNGEIINPNVQSWLKNVNDMIQKVRHFEDEINKKRRYVYRWSLSRKAYKITQHVLQLQNEGAFENVAHPAPPPEIWSIFKIGFKDFKSRMAYMNEVIEGLKREEVRMIGICRMGGVGKTTMVKEIITRLAKLNLFDKIVMATVSQSPSIRMIQLEIADQIGLQFEEESESGRALSLHGRLMGIKRILTVLDDVWTELDFEAIGLPYGDSHKGCKILLTSRDSDVCYWMSKPIIAVPTLTTEESWELFREMVGESFDDLDLRSTAKNVVKECGGLPIAIVTIGKALENKNKREWDEALNQLRNSTPMDIPGANDKVYTSIKWSYDRLESDEASFKKWEIGTGREDKGMASISEVMSLSDHLNVLAIDIQSVNHLPKDCVLPTTITFHGNLGPVIPPCELHRLVGYFRDYETKLDIFEGDARKLMESQAVTTPKVEHQSTEMFEKAIFPSKCISWLPSLEEICLVSQVFVQRNLHFYGHPQKICMWKTEKLKTLGAVIPRRKMLENNFEKDFSTSPTRSSNWCPAGCGCTPFSRPNAHRPIEILPRPINLEVTPTHLEDPNDNDNLENLCIEEIVAAENETDEIITLPKLKSIKLVSLPNLKYFCGAYTLKLSSLELLKVINLQNLRLFAPKLIDTRPRLQVTELGQAEWPEDLNATLGNGLIFHQVLFDPINHQEQVCCLFACFLCFRRESTQLSKKMSWPDLAVNKAVEVGNKNNVTCTIMNYADSVVQLAGQAAKQFYDRMGVRSFRSVKKSIQRLEEAAVSCGAPERLEILRSWVLLLKEVDRLKLSQGSGDISYNSCDGQPRGWSQATPHNLSWRAQFWPNSIKLGNNWPLAPNPLPCVTQRQGMLPVRMLPLFQKGVDSIVLREHMCGMKEEIRNRLTNSSKKMSWPDLAVNKAVEVGNKNNVTCTIMNYADSVVQLAGQAAKQFYDRMGVRSFRSVKKSIQRLEEAAVSCGAPERLEILRSWVLLLKEVDRLKLSQGSGDISYNSCDGQPRGGGVLFCKFSLCRYAKGAFIVFDWDIGLVEMTTLTMMKMEDAKPEVSASNNSNSESSDSGLLQD